MLVETIYKSALSLIGAICKIILLLVVFLVGSLVIADAKYTENIHAEYSGNFISIYTGCIFAIYLFISKSSKNKYTFMATLPLHIALVFSCYLLFFYVLAVANPAWYYIFLGCVICVMYIMELCSELNLHKSTHNMKKQYVRKFIPFLVRFCLFLIGVCAIYINTWTWFKIFLIFIPLVCTIFIERMLLTITLQNNIDTYNKIVRFSRIFTDIVLIYLSVKNIFAVPEEANPTSLIFWTCCLICLDIQMPDSKQVSTTENTNKKTNTSKNNETEVAETIDNREVEDNNEVAREYVEREENHDIEDEEEDDFDAENASLKDLIDRRITLDDKFNENNAKKVNLLMERIKLSINNITLLEKITEELNELKEAVEDDYDDLSDFIDDCNDDFDFYAHEMGIEEAHQKINILIERLEKKRVLSEMLIKLMEDINNLKENATNGRNHEQQEKKTITKKRKYTKKSPKTDKNNSTDKKDQDEYIGRFIDLE